MPRLLTLIPGRIAGRRREVERKLRVIAMLVELETRKALARPYPRASKPGEAPARRTGHLQASQYARPDFTAHAVEIGNTAPYAQKLIDRGRLWQRPVIDRLRPQIDAIVRQNMPFGGAP